MRVRQIMDRLTAEVPALAGRVREASDYTSLLRNVSLTAATGGAYVMPSGLRAGPAASATGAYVQSFDDVVAVVILVPDPNKGLGRQGATIDDLRGAVIGAVAGWMPDGAMGACQLLRGAMINLGGAALAYQIEFTIPDQLRITS